MEGLTDARRPGAVTFLPHRLNRQPIVVRGLTADELWVSVGLAAIVGLILGIPLAILAGSIAVAPTTIAACIGIGLFAGGEFVRRRKRGRPDTWLVRQLQWWACARMPSLSHHLGGADLIRRSGHWSTRRGQS
jgi:conjugative transfer region protein (TIGR03750 family)